MHHGRIPVANAFFVLLIVAAVRARTMPQSLCWVYFCLHLDQPFGFPVPLLLCLTLLVQAASTVRCMRFSAPIFSATVHQSTSEISTPRSSRCSKSCPAVCLCIVCVCAYSCICTPACASGSGKCNNGSGTFACLEGIWRRQTWRVRASDRAFTSTSNSHQAHTGSCRLVGERRGAWNLRSVHACAVDSLSPLLSLLLLLDRSLDQSVSHTLHGTAPGNTDADVAFFFVSFILIESIMLLNVSMRGHATVCRACARREGARASSHFACV
jgi:hypothetical protein